MLSTLSVLIPASPWRPISDNFSSCKSQHHEQRSEGRRSSSTLASSGNWHFRSGREEAHAEDRLACYTLARSSIPFELFGSGQCCECKGESGVYGRPKRIKVQCTAVQLGKRSTYKRYPVCHCSRCFLLSICHFWGMSFSTLREDHNVGCFFVSPWAMHFFVLHDLQSGYLL